MIKSETKLFEIPIYAFSRTVFEKRVRKYKDTLREKYRQSHSDENAKHMNDWIYLICHPFQRWDYNHIVGYIVITTNKIDISFYLFLQAGGLYYKSRYCWHSTKKWLLQDQCLTGWHFHLNCKDSSEEIRKQVHTWLDGLIKEHIPSKYYVDREAFDTADKMINYKQLLE